MILVDTNVLVYAINVDVPQHQASRNLVEAVKRGQIDGVLVPQILLEFFAIVTDHRRVENTLRPASAWQEVETLRVIVRVLDPGLTPLEHLAKIMEEAGIKGTDIFDAWLAAQMRALGISTVCTYNTGDFSLLPVITQTPEQILKAQPDHPFLPAPERLP